MAFLLQPRRRGLTNNDDSAPALSTDKQARLDAAAVTPPAPPVPEVAPPPAAPSPVIPPDPAAPPPDPYWASVARLQDVENRPVRRTNSKWASAARGAFVSAGQAARAVLASGRDVDAASLLGILGAGAGGAVGGGINDQWDEQQQKAQDVAQAREEVGFQLQRKKEEDKLNDMVAQRQAKAQELLLNQQKEKLDETKQLDNEAQFGQEQAERERANKAREAGDTEDRSLRRDELNLKRDELTNKPLPGKIPDTYYQSNKDQIKNQALSAVLPNYKEQVINPKVLDAYGGDVDRVYRAVRDGNLSMSQILVDPAKGAAFDAELATKTASLTQAAADHDRYLDMTSRSQRATRINLSDFETAYTQYQKDLAAAKNRKQRQKIQQEFETGLRGVRLVD